jgi:hypothetical protein
MSSVRSVAGMALSVTLGVLACGDDLLVDPSFELWCGDTLCMPWEVSGSVRPVKTWHRSDRGVALDDAAVISQHSARDTVDCIEFEVIADVSATAGVWLEVDFRDDGSSEYAQLIPESHWAKLRYLIKAPTWYDQLRFILRKTGQGRAVLAQISAASASDCAGEPLPLEERPNGASCGSDADCTSGLCGAVPADSGPGFALSLAGEALRACGDCSSLAACSEGRVCGAARGEAGPYTSCVPAESRTLAAFCLLDTECQSGRCEVPTYLTHATCASCGSDADCAPSEVCGARGNALGAARACEPRASRELGALCIEDAACASGVCCDGACSECCADRACEGGVDCGIAEPEAFSVEPRLCGPGLSRRGPGAPCTSGLDCTSDRCDEPDATCQLCEGADCDPSDSDSCGLRRRLAGVCR